MKYVLASLIILFFGAGPLLADQITLFGRSFDKSVAVYGSVFAPPGPSESASENAKLEFYIRPSLTFKKYNAKTSLVGYSIFALLKDSDGFSYNNKITFLLGVEVQHKLSDAVRLSFGAQAKTEHEFSTGADRSRAILTADLSLYKTWQPNWVQDRFGDGSRLVLSGWANYRYPGSLHSSEKDNGLLQGSFKFAVSMPIGESKLSFAPFVSMKAKADHKGRPFNNIVEPALGFDLKIPFKNGGDIAFGAKSVYQWRHAGGTNQTGILGYITWYKRF